MSRRTSDSNIEFHGEVASAIGTVQRRWGAIVEAVCGSGPRAQEVADRFGVYRKLGWQIWNVIYADDSRQAVKHLPNPRTFKVWREAASAKGVDAKMLARLEEAIEQFRKTASSHAPDRETFEMLVEGDGAADEETAAKWRKQSFTGNAYTWGVRAKVMLACAIIFPSARDLFFDMVRVQALIGMTRTRSNVRWPFAQFLVRDATGAQLPTGKRQPLRETAAVKETGVPLLEEYCSKPLPAVRRGAGHMGMVEDELLPGEIGSSGASDIVTGEIMREVGMCWTDKTGEVANFGTGVRTPSELLISDQLVHESLYPNVTRSLHVYGELMRPLSRDDRDRIPVPERIANLGKVIDGVGIADVPKYGAMVQDIFKQTGLNPAEFNVFRVRMRYPPIPVSVVVSSEMPVR